MQSEIHKPLYLPLSWSRKGHPLFYKHIVPTELHRSRLKTAPTRLEQYTLSTVWIGLGGTPNQEINGMNACRHSPGTPSYNVWRDLPAKLTLMGNENYPINKLIFIKARLQYVYLFIPSLRDWRVFPTLENLWVYTYTVPVYCLNIERLVKFRDLVIQWVGEKSWLETTPTMWSKCICHSCRCLMIHRVFSGKFAFVILTQFNTIWH